jgi:MFS family permease
MTGSTPLLMYSLYVVVGSLGNVVAALIMDRVGRRRLLRESKLIRLLTAS